VKLAPAGVAILNLANASSHFPQNRSGDQTFAAARCQSASGIQWVGRLKSRTIPYLVGLTR
jgi:hypothetical protein